MNSKLNVNFHTDFCIIEVPTKPTSVVNYEIYGTSGYKLFGNLKGELTNTRKHLISVPYSKSDTLFYKIKADDKIYTSFIKIELQDDIENISLDIKKIETFNEKIPNQLFVKGLYDKNVQYLLSGGSSLDDLLSTLENDKDEEIDSDNEEDEEAEEDEDDDEGGEDEEAEEDEDDDEGGEEVEDNEENDDEDADEDGEENDNSEEDSISIDKEPSDNTKKNKEQSSDQLQGSEKVYNNFIVGDVVKTVSEKIVNNVINNVVTTTNKCKNQGSSDAISNVEKNKITSVPIDNKKPSINPDTEIIQPPRDPSTTYTDLSKDLKYKTKD